MAQQRKKLNDLATAAYQQAVKNFLAANQQPQANPIQQKLTEARNKAMQQAAAPQQPAAVTLPQGQARVPGWNETYANLVNKLKSDGQVSALTKKRTNQPTGVAPYLQQASDLFAAQGGPAKDPTYDELVKRYWSMAPTANEQAKVQALGGYANLTTEQLNQMRDESSYKPTEDVRAWDMAFNPAVKQAMKSALVNQQMDLQQAQASGANDRPENLWNGNIDMVSDDYLAMLEAQLPGMMQDETKRYDEAVAAYPGQLQDYERAFGEYAIAQGASPEAAIRMKEAYDAVKQGVGWDALNILEQGDVEQLVAFDNLITGKNRDASYLGQYADETEAEDEISRLMEQYGRAVIDGQASEYGPKAPKRYPYEKVLDLVQGEREARAAMTPYLQVIAQDPEFLDKSMYISPYEGWEEWLQNPDTSKEGAELFYRVNLDKDAKLYSFINGQATAEDELFLLDNYGDVYASGYDMMTEPEKAVYNYYYNTGDMDKAREYLRLMEPALYKRASAIRDAEWEEYATDNLFTGALMFGAAGAANLASAVTYPLQLATTALGADVHYAPTAQFSGVVSQSQSAALADQDWLGFEAFGMNIPQLLYGAGSTLRDLYTARGFAGQMGNLNYAPWLQGFTAGAHDLAETEGSGMSDIERALHSGGVAGLEGLTEKLPFEMLNKVPGKLGYYVGNMLSEAGEEAVNQAAGYAWDDATAAMFGRDKPTDQQLTALELSGVENPQAELRRQRAMEIGSAALQGGLGGLGAAGIQTGIYTAQNANVGSQVKKSGNADQLVQLGTAMKEGSESRKLADAMQKRKSMGSAKLGQLYRALMADTTAEYHEVILDQATRAVADEIATKQNQQGGPTDTRYTTEELAKGIIAMADGQKISKGLQRYIETHRSTMETYREFADESKSAAWAKQLMQDRMATAVKYTKQQQQLAGMTAAQGSPQQNTSQQPAAQAAKSTSAQEIRQETEAEYKRLVGKNAGDMLSRKVTYDDGSGNEATAEILRVERSGKQLNVVVSENGTEKDIAYDALTGAESGGVARILAYAEQHLETESPEINAMLEALKDGGEATEIIAAVEEGVLAGYYGTAPQQAAQGIQQAVQSQAGNVQGAANQAAQQATTAAAGAAQQAAQKKTAETEEQARKTVAEQLQQRWVSQAEQGLNAMTESQATDAEALRASLKNAVEVAGEILARARTQGSMDQSMIDQLLEATSAFTGSELLPADNQGLIKAAWQMYNDVGYAIAKYGQAGIDAQMEAAQEGGVEEFGADVTEQAQVSQEQAQQAEEKLKAILAEHWGKMIDDASADLAKKNKRGAELVKEIASGAEAMASKAMVQKRLGQVDQATVEADMRRIAEWTAQNLDVLGFSVPAAKLAFEIRQDLQYLAERMAQQMPMRRLVATPIQDANGSIMQSARSKAKKAAKAAAENAAQTGTMQTVAAGMTQEARAKLVEQGRKIGQQLAQDSETMRVQDIGKSAAGKGTVYYMGTVANSRDIGDTGVRQAMKGVMNRLTVQQHAQVQAIEQLAKVLPVDIVFYESAQGLAKGEAIEAPNGWIDAATNTIFLDLNAGMTEGGETLVESAIIKTAGHELTHFMQRNTGAEYAEYKAELKSVLQARGESYADMVMDKLRSSTRGLTRAEAEAEVLADASEMMLRDTAAMQALAQRSPGLVGKIKKFLSDFVRRIKAGFQGLTATSIEAQAVMEAEKYVGKLQELWDDALTKAAGNVAGNVKAKVTVKAVEEAAGEKIHSFAGRESKGMNKSMLQKAEEMEKSHASAEAIRLATGWFRGMDGEWRYEIDDSKANVIAKRIMDDGIYLDHILEHPTLFNAYPFLSEMKVYLKDLGEGTLGKFDGQKLTLNMRNFAGMTQKQQEEYDSLFKSAEYLKHKAEWVAVANNEEMDWADMQDLLDELEEKFAQTATGKRMEQLTRIGWMNRDILRADEALKSTLMHEIQHAIQDHEGFASGGSVRGWDRIGVEIASHAPIISKTQAEIRELLEKTPSELAQMMVDKVRLNKEHNAAIDEWMDAETDAAFKAAQKKAQDLEKKIKEIDKAAEGYPDGIDMLHRYVMLNGVLDKAIEMNHLMSNEEKYQKTAGEIEARDVQKRLAYDEEQRREYPPARDLNAVFADNPFKRMFSDRQAPTLNARQFIDEAGEEIAETIEEKNALKIYQKKLDEYKKATREVETAKVALDAMKQIAKGDKWNRPEIAKGAVTERDGENIRKAQSRVNTARAIQARIYEELISMENTQYISQTLQRARDFLKENISGKTVEEIERDAKQLADEIEQLEKTLEETAGAGRHQVLMAKMKHLQTARRLHSLYRSRAAEKLKEQKKEFRERETLMRKHRRNRELVLSLRREIGREIKRLNTMRLNETDQRHVPKEWQHVADELMMTFTDSNLAKLAFQENRVAGLQAAYEQLRDLERDDAYYWDDEIEQKIKMITQLSEEYKKLTTSEDGSLPANRSMEGTERELEILKEVKDIVDHVMTKITDRNKAFLKDRAETFEEYAAKASEALTKRKDAKGQTGEAAAAIKALDNLLRNGNMEPIYFIEHLDNEYFAEVYDQIREGQTRYARIIKEGQNVVEEARRKHNYAAWAGGPMLTLKTEQGHVIKLTIEKAMAAYATAKREAANKLYQTSHLADGGFQYRSAKEMPKGVEYSPNTSHKLGASDIAKIEAWLTAEQKAYADELVGYMSTVLSEYGNEASNSMYGYDKFKEQYYFPFRTSAEQRYQKGDEGAGGVDSGTGRVKNSGFTKKLTRKANATIILDDFSTVVSEHINSMATYAAMVEAIENMKRLMNYKIVAEDGTTNTVRAMIGQKYGKSAQEYLQNLLRDLNGAAQSDERAVGATNYLIGAFKRGAVALSNTVLIQQPTAIFRAMAYVNPSNFIQNPFFRPSKRTWNELMKYSGTAIIKDMGKFDVGMGFTASEYIRDEGLNAFETYQRLKEQSKWRAGKKAAEKAIDWLSSAPGVADQYTWCMIWNAVKNEQAKLNPNMDTQSDAFLELCGRRFDDVIDHTQVYDSILVKSDLMRSQNALNKMATTFKAEPTKNLNMLYDALTGKHTAKERAGMILSVAFASVAAGAASGLIRAFNDDDDERTAAEKYAGAATNAIMDNLNILGMIPYVADVQSLAMGYEVERPDMSVIKDLWTYGSTFFDKAYDPKKKLEWKDYENFWGTALNLVGLPAKNISRELRRLWNAITNTKWTAPTATNLSLTVADQLPYRDESNTAYYQRMVTATMNGEEQKAKQYEEYLIASKGATEKGIRTGMREEVKRRYQAGQMTKDEAKAYLMKHGLADDAQEAYKYVDKWDEQHEADAAEEAGEDYSYSVYNTIYAAVERGDAKAARAAVDELVKNGWKLSTVQSAIRSRINKRYYDGELTKAQVKQLYMDYGGYREDPPKGFDPADENDWYWLYKELDYGKSNGSTDGYSKYGTYYQAVETGANLRNVTNEYLNRGVDKGTLSSAITNQYKEEFIRLSKTNKAAAANLQARLLNAYELLGYDRAKKLKDIQKWLEPQK